MKSRRKITAALQDQVIKLLEGGATMAIAARGVGVTRSTLYEARDRSKAFARRIDEARDLVDDQVEARMLRVALGTVQASKGEITAQIFWLKNRRPKQWRDTHAFEHAGVDGAPLVDGEALARMAALLAGGK